MAVTLVKRVQFTINDHVWDVSVCRDGDVYYAYAVSSSPDCDLGVIDSQDEDHDFASGAAGDCLQAVYAAETGEP